MRVRRRQRGIALLLVLWVFMLLGVLALPAEDFSEHASRDEQRVTEEGLTTRSASWLEKIDDRELELHPTHRLYHLQVTVSWQDGRGTKNYVLESLRMAPNNE